MITHVSTFVAKYQAVIAIACVVVLALDFVPGFDLPHAVVALLAAAAGALGVARPTETAAKLAGEVASARGGVSIAALIAALAGAFAVSPPPHEPEPANVIDVNVTHVDGAQVEPELTDVTTGTGADLP